MREDGNSLGPLPAAIWQALPVGICLCDGQGRLVAWNARAERLFGEHALRLRMTLVRAGETQPVHMGADGAPLRLTRLEPSVDGLPVAWLVMGTESESVDATQLLLTANHDLLQPMQAARMFLGALAFRLSGPEREILAKSQAALRQAEERLADVVAMARLESGMLSFEIAPVDIGGLLASLADAARDWPKVRPCEIRVVPVAQSVKADGAVLERIVSRLLDCALTAAAGRILLGARRNGERPRIVIAFDVGDTGRLAALREGLAEAGNGAGGSDRAVDIAPAWRLARAMDFRIAFVSRGATAAYLLTAGTALDASTDATAIPEAPPSAARTEGQAGRARIIGLAAAETETCAGILRGLGYSVRTASRDDGGGGAGDRCELLVGAAGALGLAGAETDTMTAYSAEIVIPVFDHDDLAGQRRAIAQGYPVLKFPLAAGKLRALVRYLRSRGIRRQPV
ncbi:PAS domain-containing sensor histidine kinase [Oceanibacterium hippocampi]|uniref:histidine kinase n=1 Tax=Oceanibacterium hippocampi TaxID=745714 RepID=A0A1Y5R8G7_9PROT|nr:PAS domain-containing protein [Oceanibacterium hippocampi]SLN11599.1 hypothetical protein OCH7691_00100 [Oceanibacterium hippocampi]